MLVLVSEAANQTFLKTRDGGHEQLISNGWRFKLAFAEREKKQTMIDPREISTGLKRLFLDCGTVPGDGGVFGTLVGRRRYMF